MRLIRALDKAIFRWLVKTPAKDEEPEVVNDPDAEDGGPGSGNWGHRGRPGLRGGSGKGGGAQYRGGRADMGNFYGSRGDWLNGLNGERQREVTNTLKFYGNGDIKAGEKAIMQGKNMAAKRDYVRAMAEARNWDEHAYRLYGNLEEKEQDRLDRLLNKLYGETIGEMLDDVDSLNANEKDELFDLMSKAMGGETSGRESKKNDNSAITGVMKEATESAFKSKQQIRMIAYLQRATGSDFVPLDDMSEDDINGLLTKLESGAFESRESLTDTRMFLVSLGLSSGYNEKLLENQGEDGDELCRENLDLLRKYVPDVDVSLQFPAALVAAEDQMLDDMTMAERQKYLSNKYQILGGANPLKANPSLKSGLSQSLLDSFALNNVQSRQATRYESGKTPSESEIVSSVGGGDRTKGSCASVSLAYVGNKYGWNVRDFRGGRSLEVFAQRSTAEMVAGMEGVVSHQHEALSDYESARVLMAHVEQGKEYILTIGSHAAVVRRSADGAGYEYLELQSRAENGWHSLDNKVLKKRFKCHKSRSVYGHTVSIKSFLVEAESLGKSDAFGELLSYLNTAEDAQKKGERGRAK